MGSTIYKTKGHSVEKSESKTVHMLPLNVIINADDFGFDSHKNIAIVKCFKKGLINSTSIMTNMPTFPEAIELANRHHFHDKIGLHTCLTEGRPLTDLSGTPLVDDDGFFIREQIYKPKNFLYKSIRKQVKQEIVAQLELLFNHRIFPTHINSHHKVAELPWLLPIFFSIGKKHNIKLRISQTWSTNNSLLKESYRSFVNGFLRFQKLNFTNYFEVLEIYEDIRKGKNQRHGLIEIMVHPDLNDTGEIVDSFDGIYLEKFISEKVF